MAGRAKKRRPAPQNDRPRLEQVVSIRLPDVLHNQFYAAARAAGVSVGEAVRRHLAGEPIVVAIEEGKRRRTLTIEDMERMAQAAAVLKRAKPPKPDDVRRRLLYEVNKAGNNLNQLAHRANAAHLAGQVSEATYALILAELDAIRRAMLAALE